jgi:uncharacterized protein YegP (UPF0339 family)
MAQEFFTDGKGEHRWRVIGRNGFDILGDSGEGYRNELDCVKGLLALVDAVDVEQLRSRVGELEGRGDQSS